MQDVQDEGQMIPLAAIKSSPSLPEASVEPFKAQDALDTTTAPSWSEASSIAGGGDMDVIAVDSMADGGAAAGGGRAAAAPPPDEPPEATSSNNVAASDETRPSEVCSPCLTCVHAVGDL